MVSNVINNVYYKYFLCKQPFWNDFRKAHPVLFSILSVINRSYKVCKFLQYCKIYRQFKNFTLSSRDGYVNNLTIADQYRNVEGAVVECGSWRGGMIAGIAKLYGDHRDYYLFDSFEGLPTAKVIDGKDPYGRTAKAWQAQSTTNLKTEEAFAQKAMLLSGVRNFHIVKGWFNETLPAYDANKKIALLRLDGDWYESTMDALTNLYQHVVEGGLIIIDDYYYWDGCCRAVHEFLAKNGLVDRIRQFNDGCCYILKEIRAH